MQLWIWTRFHDVNDVNDVNDVRKPFCQVSPRHRGVRPLSYSTRRRRCGIAGRIGDTAADMRVVVEGEIDLGAAFCRNGDGGGVLADHRGVVGGQDCGDSVGARRQVLKA